LPLVLSLVSVEAPNLLVVEARPVRRGSGIIALLREVDGTPLTIRADAVSVHVPVQRVDEVNVVEDTLREGVDALSFRPFEAKFVRLNL
jgi:hypothetical protein